LPKTALKKPYQVCLCLQQREVAVNDKLHAELLVIESGYDEIGPGSWLGMMQNGQLENWA
jgi:hypothetical protein